MIDIELKNCIFCGKKLIHNEKNNPCFYANKTFDKLIGKYFCCKECDINIVHKARLYLSDKNRS